MLYGPRCSLFVDSCFGGGPVALTYEDMRRYNKVLELVLNRCKVINAVTEDRAEVRYSRGYYRFELFGRELARWRLYDLAAVQDAYSRADAVYRALWDSRRLGFSTFA